MAEIAFVSTSGWTEQELQMLRALTAQTGTDRSKLIRGLVRKEYERRMLAEQRRQERIKAERGISRASNG